MRVITAIALLLVAACATPQPKMPLVVYGKIQATNARVTLFDAPCESAKVLQIVPVLLRARMKAADGSYEGVAYESCWLFSNGVDGDIVLVWEDGGIGELPNRYIEKPVAL